MSEMHPDYPGMTRNQVRGMKFKTYADVIILGLVIAVVLTTCGISMNRIAKEQAACVEKGVAYFKEIGSYPRLKAGDDAGRSAREVADERCGRTKGAFGPL